MSPLVLRLLHRSIIQYNAISFICQYHGPIGTNQAKSDFLIDKGATELGPKTDIYM